MRSGPTVQMRHPDLDEPVRVPASAVPQHTLAGWVVDDSEPLPETCPLCGRTDPPPGGGTQTEAPAAAGASPSQAPRGRRRTKED